MKRALLCLCAMLATACSTASKDIAPSYASAAPYQGYSCEQIASQSARIDARAAALAERLDAAARHDRETAVVGTLFFLPALFALGGTKEEEAEYARLKGEREALQRTALAKGCLTGGAAGQPRASED